MKKEWNQIRKQDCFWVLQIDLYVNQPTVVATHSHFSGSDTELIYKGTRVPSVDLLSCAPGYKQEVISISAH